MFKCPVCVKDKPFQAIDEHSEEAAKLCLLCEAESVCLPCQKKQHPQLWSGDSHAPITEGG